MFNHQKNGVKFLAFTNRRAHGVSPARTIALYDRTRATVGDEIIPGYLDTANDNRYGLVSI